MVSLKINQSILYFCDYHLVPLQAIDSFLFLELSINDRLKIITKCH